MCLYKQRGITGGGGAESTVGLLRRDKYLSHCRHSDLDLSTHLSWHILHAHQSRMDTSWDEYDAYDFSEFSAADFVPIDSNTTGATTRHNHRATAQRRTT